MPSEPELTIKASYCGDIRKFSIENNNLTYDDLVLTMQRLYEGTIPPKLVMKYKDEDGDLVTLNNTKDLSYAIQCSR